MSALRFAVHSLIIVALFLIAASYSYAQLPSEASNVTIKMSPNYPEPFEEVRATLDAYSYNTNGATIQWFVDGIEDVSAKNTREVTFTVGELGEPTTLGVFISLPDGQTLSASKVITPARVDVVIEADTSVPIFYKGRALPSSGSSVRAIAVPSTGEDPNSLTYTWKLGNKVLFGGSQVGRNVAIFDAPLGGSVLLTVVVAAKNREILTQKVISVPNFNPEIYFYETNPLRGLSRSAIQSPHSLIGDEMTVRAGVYYMDKNIFNSDPFTEWEINGRRVDNPSNNPQEITLRGGGGTGSFRVGFHLRNLDNLLQGIRDDFIVAF